MSLFSVLQVHVVWSVVVSFGSICGRRSVHIHAQFSERLAPWSEERRMDRRGSR